MNYKNTTVKICSSCNVKKLKACAANYKSTFLDCSICQKAVIYNSTILCSNCDHWVHQKCTELTKNDITIMENSSISWFCDKCCCDIFPFSQIDTVTESPALGWYVSATRVAASLFDFNASIVLFARLACKLSISWANYLSVSWFFVIARSRISNFSSAISILISWASILASSLSKNVDTTLNCPSTTAVSLSSAWASFWSCAALFAAMLEDNSSTRAVSCSFKFFSPLECA